MSVSRMFDNLWVKLAAVVLAVLLWFHVATDKVYQHQYTIPLTQIDLDETLVLTEPPPDSVTVSVSARGKILLRTDWKKKGVRLVADHTRVGRFKVDISAANLSLVQADKVTLIDVIEPREMYFTCDRRTTRELPVKSRLVVVPDEGYAIYGSDSLEPGVVKVSGPNRRVGELSMVETQEMVLEYVRSSFSKKLGLTTGDIYGMSFEPDSVLVHVRVGPVRRKVIPDLKVGLINAPRLRQYQIEPPAVEIRVSGQADAIDSLSPDMISVIADFVLIDSAGSIPIQVVLPPTISLIQKSADSVKITMTR